MKLRVSSLAAAVILLTGVVASISRAQSVDAMPLNGGSVVYATQTLTVPANGGGSSLHLPNQGTLQLDYSIQPTGTNLLLMVVTGEQYQAIVSGEQASGMPPMRTIVSGDGSQSVSLAAGDYYVAWLFPNDPVSAQLTWRASVR